MKQPSASNAEAFAMCGTSHVLPQSDKHNDYMSRGNEGHAPLASRLNGKIPDTTERGHSLVQDFPLDVVMRGVSNWRGEAAFAVNVKTRTSRLIGINIGRNYGPLEKYEIPCTLDADGEKNGRPFIRDWKFGVSASWMQLMVQCMAVAYDDPESPMAEVDAGFVFIDGETRGAEYREDARIVSLEEIDEAADRLVKAWDRVEDYTAKLDADPNIVLPTVEGPWCTYCGAFAHCPSKWNLARQMMAGYLEEYDPKSAGELSPAAMGALYEKLREAKKLIEGVTDVLKIAAAKRPLPLPNGKQLVMLRVKGAERIDKPAMYRVLKELGAGEDDLKAIVKKGSDYVTPKEMKP